MTQPSFVPIVEADQVRPAYRLEGAEHLDPVPALRAAGTAQPEGRRLGTPGPDQGFALKLARRFEDRLVLAEGESAEDAIAGCTAVAMRRCARFGRAPAVYDLSSPSPCGASSGALPPIWSRPAHPLFRSAAHHYQAQRAIADSVHEDDAPAHPRRRGRADRASGGT